MITICLLLLLAGFVYPFIIYPPLLRYLVSRQLVVDSCRELSDWPSVALVICALNEQKIIRQKLDNTLALDYPRERLRVIVVSDGSTDQTAAIVSEFAHAGVRLIEHSVRRGKSKNLNEVVADLRDEIVVLSDANVIYEASAIRQLVGRFQDDRVGCVSGKVILVDTTETLRTGTDDYYSLEWQLQADASQLYSMVGADGAMYAIRRNLFLGCPADTIIEDFVIPMGVVLQGKRIVFEPSAVGWEQGTTSVTEEFKRKTRIAAGAMQCLMRGNGWPGVWSSRLWFVFVSHKLLRWISPVMGACTFILAIFTCTNPLSMVVVGAYLLASICAAATLVTKQNSKTLNAVFYFVLGQIALAIGLFKGLTGCQSVLWAKADR